MFELFSKTTNIILYAITRKCAVFFCRLNVEECGGDENSELKSVRESTEPVTVILTKMVSLNSVLKVVQERSRISLTL